MSALHYGLTPKMKPISPRRSGACRRARCRHQQDRLPDRAAAPARAAAGAAPPQPRHRGARLRPYRCARHEGRRGGRPRRRPRKSIRQAVDWAERMAAVRASNPWCSRSRPAGSAANCSPPRSTIVGSAVAEGDIARVLAAGSRHSVRDGPRRAAFAADRLFARRRPTAFAIRAACSASASASTCTSRPPIVTAARNLMLAVERCHLDVEAMVASPYVAGLSVLADDEADLGAAVIDMGAGTTTMAVFLGGRFVHADGFALGGQHVTMDLARGLNVAHRRRRAHQDLLRQRARRRLGRARHDHGCRRSAKTSANRRNSSRASALVHIIKPRVEEILEMVRDRLAASLVRGRAARPRDPHRRRQPAHRTCRNLRARIFGRPVRIGRPLGIAGCRTRPRARPSRPRRACWSTRRRRISNTSNARRRGT